jgi:CheY-like chemotaxis protein
MRLPAGFSGGNCKAVTSNSCISNTILVVEDELLIRLMIADALREAGFEVLEASTADEALTIIKSGMLIHLVFTDVRMPGTMDGVALMSRLREARPDLKLAVASGYSPDWPSPNLADAFIGKPYDVTRAVNRMKALLNCE